MLIIDRLEGNWAVIEYDGQMFNLPRSLLPQAAKEGDIIRIAVTVDKQATATLRKNAKSLLDNFFDE